MALYSLSAVGEDRPGIVSAVSGALVDLGCNLEDSTMTILQGHFAILLVVEAPEAVSAADLERSLLPVASDFDLTLAVRPLSEEVASRQASGDPWTISVHGADRPGIVHSVTAALADAGGNVVDLSTHLVGDPGSPAYVMTMRAMFPPGAEGEAAAEQVCNSAKSVGVQCTVHRDEADVL
jgi:glycine cleavage system transcriptional repressor